MPGLTKHLDQRLLIKVSKLYYEQKLTQQDIAARLHLSRSQVSRLLQKARESGIVLITVGAPSGAYTALENALEQRFGLKEVNVVEVSQPLSYQAVAHELGVAAAQYVQRTLIDDDVVGVSWGTTLNAMVNALPPLQMSNAHIVQIIGGLGPPEAEVHATDICRRFAHSLNCRLSLIAAPGITDTPETKLALMGDSHLQQTFSLFPRLTVVFVGIGTPTPSSVLMRDGSIISPEQLNALCELGTVGDIGLRFFDAWGHIVNSSLDDRVVGISPNQLRKIERVVGIAGGSDKIEAICGAVRGGLINVLITDVTVADALMTCEL